MTPAVVHPPVSPLDEPARDRVFGLPVAAGVSWIAGLLTAFTVSLVGEMPLGEVILMATAGWAGLCLLANRAWPGDLFRERWVWTLLACQAIALVAYVVSDVYRGSSHRDMARGWGRMIFLAIDIIAFAYLFSCSRRNLLWYLFGQALGDVAAALIFGPLFGDMWKFGVGVPVTFAVFFLASFGGRYFFILIAAGMGVLHFAMDFRSVGGICLLIAAASTLQLLPRRLRLWAVPFICAGALAAVSVVYSGMQDEESRRGTRSDVARSSMMQAAWEAFVESPLIGQGSWFNKSKLYDNFGLILYERAKDAGIGGFGDPGTEISGVAIHSQMLVTLAEGGLFGATFFMAFAGMLMWALWNEIMVQPWDRASPVRLMQLFFAFWNVWLSPYSGAHRVYIAAAVGLVLILRAERAEQEDAEES